MRRDTYRPVRIFIATPGDLKPERMVLLDIVSEVNTIKAHRSGFHIEVLGWEQTLPGKGRPQDLINEEIRKCDLFIIVFWEHWGTPSGEYSSGTEEEFYVAKSLNEKTGLPEIWLFFKDAVNTPDSHITDFKKQREEKRDVYFRCFKSTTDWREMLRSFLCRWIDSLEDATVGSNKVVERTQEQKYSNILYRITYQDWIWNSSKCDPTIYFTIEDNVSFENWKKLSREKKKQFIFDLLSENLGLIIGANPYLAQMRYKLSDSQYILLATIVRKYEDTLETSRIFIPSDYRHLCTKSENEIPFYGYV